MKKIFLIFAFLSSIVFAKEEMLLSCANAYVATMKNNPDISKLVNGAKAILIFPNIKKFGLIAGGMYGEGIAMYKNGSGYSINGVEISDASIGLQIGYESSYIVIYIMNQEIINNMRMAKLHIGADASIVVGDFEGSAGTLSALQKDLYVYTNKKGLFVGASLGGVVLNTKNKVSYNSNDYGYDILMRVVNQE